MILLVLMFFVSVWVIFLVIMVVDGMGNGVGFIFLGNW